MDGPITHPRPDSRIRALMEDQHGLASRDQLRGLGLGDGAIDARTRRGALVRVARGVYTTGTGRLTQEGRWMAAVLSVGGGAVLSHRSAAALWMLWRPSPLVELTAPRARRRTGADWIQVHRSRRLARADWTRKRGIPVTRPARTLLDLAEVVERRPLERALDEAERLRLFTDRQLGAVVERNPGRIGAARLQAVLEEHAIGTTATENDFEEAMLALCRESGLPQPEAGAWLLERYRADFVWRSSQLIVETDGRETHGTRRAFEADRARDAELAAAGWTVLRFTWRHLTRRPEWVVDVLRRSLAVTGRQGRSR